MRFLLLSVLLLFFFTAVGQSENEYLGVIALQDSTFISYKIIFTENNGIVNGYSITNLSGEHETKSMITGTYDKKEKLLVFNESGIVYTKSSITQEDFCYIHFTGRLARLNNKRSISGIFTGKYADGTVCINGEISLNSLTKITKRATKLDKTIDKSILISKEKKDRVNLSKTLDTLNLNFIKANEKVQVFTKDTFVTLTVVDAGQSDGDRISIQVDKKPLLTNSLISTVPQSYKLPFSGASILIEVKATSAGTIGANTVRLDLVDSRNTIETITNMKAGESAQFFIIKQ